MLESGGIRRGCGVGVGAGSRGAGGRGRVGGGCSGGGVGLEGDEEFGGGADEDFFGGECDGGVAFGGAFEGIDAAGHGGEVVGAVVVGGFVVAVVGVGEGDNGTSDGEVGDFVGDDAVESGGFAAFDVAELVGEGEFFF